MTRLATPASRKTSALQAWPRNPLSFAGGLAMLGAGAAVVAMPNGSPAEAASTFGYGLAVVGSLELLTALGGIGRSARSCLAADTLLGAVSLVAALLLLGAPRGAASAALAVTMWLIARGAIDLLASAAMNPVGRV